MYWIGMDGRRNRLWAVVVGVSLAMGSSVFAQGAKADEEAIRTIAINDGQVDYVVLEPGHLVSVEFDGKIADISVGNTSVADVRPLTDSSIEIQGGNTGQTNIVVYDENQRFLGEIDLIVGLDYPELESTLNRMIAGAKLEVASANNRILLFGSVPSQQDFDFALAIATQFADEFKPIFYTVSFDEMWLENEIFMTVNGRSTPVIPGPGDTREAEMVERNFIAKGVIASRIEVDETTDVPDEKSAAQGELTIKIESATPEANS